MCGVGGTGGEGEPMLVHEAVLKNGAIEVGGRWGAHRVRGRGTEEGGRRIGRGGEGVGGRRPGGKARSMAIRKNRNQGRTAEGPARGKHLAARKAFTSDGQVKIQRKPGMARQ